MSQTTWVCNKDTRVASRQSDGLNQGAGASPALPFGYYSGYIYRAYLAFDDDIGDLNIIDKAVLWLRTSDQYYVSFGSDPDLNVTRLTEWSEGEGSSTGLSTGNATVYGDAPYDGATIVQKDVTTAINTWVSIDITALIRAAKTAGAFHGLMLSSTGTGSSDVGEFWAREKGTSYRPYIVVDYTNNRAPNAPTLTGPASGAKYASTTTGVTLSATASDPDAGDSVLNYDMQVATDAGFSSLVYNGVAIPSGISGMNISRSTSGHFTHSPGTYYWRVRTKDAAGLVGPWSSARTFIINALPGVTNANMPSGGVNHVAPIWNLTDLVTAFTPKAQFSFVPTAPDGEAITGYKVEVIGVGTTEVLGSWASGSTITHKFATALNLDQTYQVRIQVRDAFEGYGDWSSSIKFVVRYAQAIYQFNIPGATSVAVVGSGATLLYRTATGANGAGASAWTTTPPTTVAAYLNVLVRTASAAGTGSTQPKVTSLSVTYFAAGGSVRPYNWALLPDDTRWSIDSTVRRFGTKSVRLAVPASGAYHFAQQTFIGLEPDTDYMAAAWVKVESPSGNVWLEVTNADDVAYVIKQVDMSLAGWQQVVVPFHTGEGQTGARIKLVADTGVAPPTVIWWDGIQMSLGSVLPVWSPALLSTGPTYVDALGAKWKSSLGSTIELGAASQGITFGGDVTVARDSSGRLMYSTPLGATAPRFGMSFDSGHASPASGWFIWNAGDSTPRASLGKHTGGLPALLLGPGNAAQDAGIYRHASVGATAILGGTLMFTERAAHANAPADSIYMWAQDNGSGKTQLVIRYATGNIIVLNTQV